MNYEGLIVSEKIEEAMRICARKNPIYEQVGNFSMALYVMGYLKDADLMSVDDVDTTEAAVILKEHFQSIDPRELPSKYDIRESDERFLLVVGDPAMPEHFALLVNSASPQPYFSKLKFYGSGFDSLEELKAEFVGKDGIGVKDIHFYRKKISPAVKPSALKKIYTIKDDGSYSVLELQLA